MRRKLKTEVETEKILLKIGIIRFSGNSVFSTLCQKLLFSLSCFSFVFLLLWNLFVSSFHSVRIKLKFWVICDVCFVGSLTLVLLITLISMIAIESILSSKKSFSNFSRKMLGYFSRGTLRLKVNNVLKMVSVDKNSFYCINSKVIGYGNKIAK